MTVDRATRETYILDLLAKDGSLSVSALSRDLGVSEVTVRANLREFERQGLLTRTHGGAMRTSVVDILDRQRSRWMRRTGSRPLQPISSSTATRS